MVDPAHGFDPGYLRRVFAAFPTGITLVSGLFDGTPVGLLASSFTSVSLEPALVSVCVAHSSTTWPLLRDARRLGVSMIAADQEEVCRQLAGQGADRFVELSWQSTPDGAVVLDGVSAWYDCSIEAQHPAGDHDIVVLRVHDLGADPSRRPLVFHGSRFHRLAL